MKKQILSLMLITSLIISAGCSTVKPTIQSAVDNQIIKTGTKYASSFALKFVKDEVKRAEVALWCYNISASIKSLTTGSIPSIEEMEGIIKLWKDKAPDLDAYAEIASVISDIYKTYYDKIKGNPKLAVDVISQIADGLQESASKYITK
jgi:hypothetical protein